MNNVNNIEICISFFVIGSAAANLWVTSSDDRHAGNTRNMLPATQIGAFPYAIRGKHMRWSESAL